MTDADPTAAEHHGRHEALPPKGGGNLWRTLFIVLASLALVAIVAALLWIFVFDTSGGGGTPTNPPTSSAPTEPPVTPPPLQACAPGDIIVTLGSQASPGAGQVQVPINFENTGSGDCTLEGFPAVVMVWQDGSPFGAAATDDSGPAPVVPITLQPGGTPAQALLTVATAADACDNPLDAIGFQVTLPGGGEPLVAQAEGYQGCDDTSINLLRVSAIAGANAP